MPSSLFGVFLLIAFAFPGFTYQRTVARTRPERVQTGLQELLEILFMSVVIDGVTTLVVAAVAAVGGIGMPKVSSLIMSPRAYAAAHVGLMSWWLTVGFCVANVLAFGLASGVLERLLRRVIPHGTPQALAGNSQQSAWWLVFRAHPELTTHVGCIMQDGSYVAGDLYSFSRSAVEGAERDLVLSGCLEYRAPGQTRSRALEDVSVVVVSSGEIAVLTVSYVEQAGQGAD